ncbi:MAG: hypothetical protein QNL04_14190 [SAR324 cluster bacterium]|nr:hypothetical protein [SAR324 cluster bacterium]
MKKFIVCSILFMHFIPTLFAGSANIELSNIDSSDSNHLQTAKAGTQFGVWAGLQQGSYRFDSSIAADATGSGYSFNFDYPIESDLFTVFYGVSKQATTLTSVESNSTYYFEDTSETSSPLSAFGVNYLMNFGGENYLSLGLTLVTATEKVSYSYYYYLYDYAYEETYSATGSANHRYNDFSLAYAGELSETARFALSFSPAVTSQKNYSGDYSAYTSSLGHGQRITLGFGAQKQDSSMGIDITSEAKNEDVGRASKTEIKLDGQLHMDQGVIGEANLVTSSHMAVLGGQDYQIQSFGVALFKNMTSATVKGSAQQTNVSYSTTSATGELTNATFMTLEASFSKSF